MWYEVQELKNQGFNNSQISRQTGLDRATVRKYLQMKEKEFHLWISSPRKMPLKLSKYIDFVRKDLLSCPSLSAAQVEDHLKEHFSDFPHIHSKTVYNLVQTVRKKYAIAKPKLQEQRVFEKLPELPYGKQAQVDFGESWQKTKTNKRKKVYFFVIVLSRSRYKYVYFSDKPFTGEKAIVAHDLAFEYFQGIPQEILYDQDSIFIHNENLGDYLLTEKFSSYCQSQVFKPIFCRKSDPQSKGKVENVVKYVKQNFLRGREFINIEILQQQAIEWLQRTANQKVHAGIQKVPKKCWEEEKKHLLPIKHKRTVSQSKKDSYNVRKDNTIVYKSNFYTLPAGTYKGEGTQVFLEEKSGQLYLYSSKNELIAKHKKSPGKGEYIRNTDHHRRKSDTLIQMQEKVLEHLGQSDIARDFLEKLHKNKARYYRDNLQELLKHKLNFEQNIIDESLLFCIENKQYNAFVLLDVMKSKYYEKQQAEQLQNNLPVIEQDMKKKSSKDIDTKVETSDINQYDKLFEQE